MGKVIYNVDLDGTVTPLRVRDAIVTCFWEAHCKDTGLLEEEREANKAYCKLTVERAFKETNGDFNNPTKESIINCMDSLANFSKSFRDPLLIKQHYGEIMELVGKLK